LFGLGVPEPQVSQYLTFTELQDRSSGGMQRDGAGNVTWLFRRLSKAEYARLKEKVEAAITAGAVFMTTQKTDSTGAGPSWVDVTGEVYPLNARPTTNAGGYFFDNVEVTANAVSVVNDPSTYN
jgi:hypothetical protein